MKTFTINTSSEHFPVIIKNVVLFGQRMLGEQDCLVLETQGGEKHWFPYREINRLSEYPQDVKTCDDMGPG